MNLRAAYKHGQEIALARHKVATVPWGTLAAGAALPAAMVGGMLASKPGVQASMKAPDESGAGVQAQDTHAVIPPEIETAAERAHQAMLSRGINPATLRVAIDAPPGAGKSVLSKALAARTGLKHYGLDWLPEDQKKFTGSHLEQMPHPPRAGEIVEHHNLLRTHDPELFDAALYIDKDAETIKKQILARGRAARMADFYNYPKTIGVGRLAYGTLAGEDIDLGGGVRMKLRPQTGWGAEGLDQMLQQKNIDPTGLSRHEKLLSLHEGRRTTGSGWTPYAQNPLSGGQTAMALGGIPLGMAAALAARHLFKGKGPAPMPGPPV